jgi:hypothetical protein
LASKLSEVVLEQMLNLWIVKSIGFDEHCCCRSACAIETLEDFAAMMNVDGSQ